MAVERVRRKAVHHRRGLSGGLTPEAQGKGMQRRQDAGVLSSSALLARHGCPKALWTLSACLEVLTSTEYRVTRTPALPII